MRSNLRTVIIGVGNAYSGDDAAGLVAAQRLREVASDRAMILTETGDPARLIEAWKGADTAVIIDAMRSNTRPGAIRRLDAGAQQIPRDLLRYSTHRFGVADAIELARVVNALPSHVIIYGIEGRHFQAGAGLSLEVEKAVGRVVELVMGELQTEV